VDVQELKPEFVEEGISLTDLFKIIWSNIIIVFLVTLWVTVLGIIYTFVIVEPTYTAESSITIQVDISETTTSDQSALSVSQNLVSFYKAFAVTDLVLNRVIEEIDALDGIKTTELRKMITVSTVASVPIIYIQVENTDNELAARISNSIIDNSIEAGAEFRLLNDNLKALDPATVPLIQSSPNTILNVVISFILGGILSLGIVFLKEVLNNKFQSSQEMEKYLNINIIATVPGTVKERKLVD
jgi:capsular polysaccharide biosynthesis protein